MLIILIESLQVYISEVWLYFIYMDSQGEGTTWFGNICQNLQALSSVVDDIPFEESFKYVEEQLLAAGENVKQFCSDVINDIRASDMMSSMDKEEAHDSVSEQNKDTDLTSHKGSNSDVSIDHEKGILCDINASPHSSLVEPVEENHIDSSSKHIADIGVDEESNVSVKSDISTAKLSASVNLPESSEIKDPNKAGTSGNALSAVASRISKKTSAQNAIFEPKSKEKAVFEHSLKLYLIALKEDHRQEYSKMAELQEKKRRDELASCSEDVDPESGRQNSKLSFPSLDDDWEIV
ncbi:hypothetical protein LguiA_025124 [Lonicera macranthoides]